MAFANEESSRSELEKDSSPYSYPSCEDEREEEDDEEDDDDEEEEEEGEDESEETHSDGLEIARLRAARRRKTTSTRDGGQKPTLEDLQLVGDLLFAERPTVGYSALEQKELIALGDVSDLDAEGRGSVFEKGLHFEKKGKPGLALQCYLACIQGLDGSVGLFPQLPLCLRHIARLYFAEEDYEKAVHFVQAEKLYYETALLATEEMDGSDSPREAPEKPDDLRRMMVARAQEFELLADMCLHSKNIGLALDYIGKAAKINEAVFGKDDPRSNQAYEKFSYIYAEAGKIQYNDALKRFQRRQSQQQIQKEQEEEPSLQEEVFTPEQSLGQQIFSLLLLFIFFIIIIVEILLVILSFSKGYLYIPSTREILNVFSYLWVRTSGN